MGLALGGILPGRLSTHTSESPGSTTSGGMKQPGQSLGRAAVPLQRMLVLTYRSVSFCRPAGENQGQVYEIPVSQAAATPVVHESDCPEEKTLMKSMSVSGQKGSARAKPQKDKPWDAYRAEPQHVGGQTRGGAAQRVGLSWGTLT